MRHVIGAVAAIAAIAAIALPGCAVSRAPLPANHPANPSAPGGRLAGPPASLRPGVVEYKDVPPVRVDEPTPSHEHHHHGS